MIARVFLRLIGNSEINRTTWSLLFRSTSETGS